MILVISVCKERISDLEFVKPVENLLSKNNIPFLTKHYEDVSDIYLDQSDKIIICGTSLKDFEYLKKLDKFSWVKNAGKPLLGICAGMQIISKIMNEKLDKKKLIGQIKVESKKDFDAYFLSSFAVKSPKNFEVLGKADKIPCILRHKKEKIHCYLFHPEVLNPEIILNFSK